MAETLFRFNVIRPPLAPDPRYPPILLAQESEFQLALGAEVSRNPNDPRRALESVSNTYVASPKFVQPDATEANNVRLAAASAALDKIDPVNLDHPRAVQTLTTALGVPPADFVRQDWVEPLLERIRDSILALRQLGIEEKTGHLLALSQRLRTVETITKVVNDSSFPFDADDLRLWRVRPILAPTFAELKSILSTAQIRAEKEKEAEDLATAAQERAERLFADRRRLEATLKAVVGLPSGQRVTVPPRAFTPQPIPSDLTHVSLVKQNLGLVTRLSDLAIKQYQFSLDSVNTRPSSREARTAERSESEPGLAGARDAAASATIPLAASIAPLVDMSKTLLDRLGQVQPQATAPAFKPVDFTPFALKPSALKLLPEDAVKVLEENSIEVTSRPITTTVTQLHSLLEQNTRDLDAEYQPSRSTIAKVKRVGDTFVRIRDVSRIDWQDAFDRGAVRPPFLPIVDWSDIIRILRPAGRVTILGVSDLLVVKQQLIGYEGGDLAHVENILKGESKSREFSATETVETETFLETETTKEKETSTSTAERFEMVNESNKALKESSSKKAGITISASYGPTVSVSASANVASDRSKEESTKVANQFSREITTQASDRIQQRVLERRTTRTLTETISKDMHAFDNVKGGGHIAGMYQWLNKVYEAQTWNYGQRTMLDFMLPEPGAFLFDQMTEPSSDQGLTAVPDFDLKPEDITPAKYMKYGVLYGVTDLEPPPPYMRTASSGVTSHAGDAPVKQERLELPDGYRVVGITAHVTGMKDAKHPDNSVTIVCGNFHYTWDASESTHGITNDIVHFAATWGVPLPPLEPDAANLSGSAGTTDVRKVGQRNELVWAASLVWMAHFAATIQLELQRTPEALDAWRARCWAKLRTAATNQMEKQKAALAKAKVDASFSPIQGRNPEKNLIMMRNEVKKMCISIMTDQHFDNFSAIQTSSLHKGEAGKPSISQINIEKAWDQGPYVRFFEQAFEWDEMTWLTYPYFWGRKGDWFKKIDYEDEDPVFEKFMQAGYARANVPVRPGFEGALEYFLATGKTWRGGALPGISSPAFLPLVQEIQESLGKKTEEPERYGEPWKVRVPTNLVRLRRDDVVPKWVKNEAGEWVSADE
ncbi:MAG: hypothetical protein M1817_004099 [Caeruleum heppii]|nr:MAG: hypothetical protein M1817_004099 [Caeruleum heppii]